MTTGVMTKISYCSYKENDPILYSSRIMPFINGKHVVKNRGNYIIAQKQQQMKMNLFSNKVKVFFLSIVFFCTGLHLNAQHNPLVKEEQKAEQKEVAFPKASQYNNTKLTYKIISAPNNSFGYDVYADGKLMIHQNSIPAMPGNNGFKTKAAAEKVAQLVIQKIKKGEMPPTISIEEMKKLKAVSP